MEDVAEQIKKYLLNVVNKCKMYANKATIQDTIKLSTIRGYHRCTYQIF